MSATPAQTEESVLRQAPMSAADSLAASAELVRQVQVRCRQPCLSPSSVSSPPICAQATPHALARSFSSARKGHTEADRAAALPPQESTPEGEWEKPLDGLTQGAAEAAKQQNAVAQEAGSGPNAVGTPCTRYRLRLLRADLTAPPSDTDAQTVFDSPAARSKKLGREERPDVEVVEQRKVWGGGKLQVWLRLHGGSGSEERWLKQSCPNGGWELAPRQSAAGLQTDFFLETNLRLLVHTIDRDPTAAAILMESARSFADAVHPLGLFDSTSGAIDRALQAMLEWLTTRAAAPDAAASGSDADAVSLLVKLTVARGTLPSTLRLAKFFSAHPAMLRKPGAMEVLSKLWAVDCYEPAAQGHFIPVPGSTEGLLAAWEESVFGEVSKDAEGCLDELAVLLEAGDSEAACDLVRANVTQETFS